MTSSGHTGERAIHSSDLSAFTKRSHCPSLLRFLTHLLPLWLSVCTSATASVELCSPRGEVPWSFVAVNRRARDSSLAMTRTDKYNYMFRVHACGLWDLNVICENLRLITLRSQLEVCEKESSIFFPVALRRPPRLLANPRPLVNPRPGVRMFSSRRRRVSRQASPFLSLPHQSMCARIHRLNSRMIICFLARGHVILFPSG